MRLSHMKKKKKKKKRDRERERRKEEQKEKKRASKRERERDEEAFFEAYSARPCLPLSRARECRKPEPGRVSNR